jgi:uracil-DNA glycosylase family 4
MPDSDELRSELADIAASLRAYLELQTASGASGIPRGPSKARTSATLEPQPEKAEQRASLTSVSSPREGRTPPTVIAPSPPRFVAALTPAAPAVAQFVDRHIRLPELAREIANCTKCALSRTRKQTVFARGNPEAAICFIGEAPGADEDAQGLPFVGRAGQLLDKMIEAMGLSPERDVYVTNIIRCRPPENRKPVATETAACIPYLHEQLDLVRPKVIVAMGNTAVGTLLNTTVGISKLRGEWKLYRGTTPLMPTYHPSYLLRPSAQQAEAKKQAWEDLQAVLRELQLPIPAQKKRAPTRTDEDPT